MRSDLQTSRRELVSLEEALQVAVNTEAEQTQALQSMAAELDTAQQQIQVGCRVLVL